MHDVSHYVHILFFEKVLKTTIKVHMANLDLGLGWSWVVYNVQCSMEYIKI
jgi:hypothetical protein